MFYQHLYKHEKQLLKVQNAFNLETIILCWDLIVTNCIHFRSLEFVCRVSETQLQVIDNLN